MGETERIAGSLGGGEIGAWGGGYFRTRGRGLRYHPGVARIAQWLCVAGLAFVGGCTPIPKGFDSPEPAARMEAAVAAADRGDLGAIPELIGLLDSDDPATRMVAIRSLERLTGETLGYEHAAGEGERGAAIGRWVEWERARADGEVGPAGVSAGEASDG